MRLNEGDYILVSYERTTSRRKWNLWTEVDVATK